MRTLLVGECAPERLFNLSDPDEPTESEFELAVAKALSCLYKDYYCIVFGGTFLLDGRGWRPDLALVARNFSHWFIIEVELTTHSFANHVFPQVRAFRYGEPQADCVTVLARELDVSRERIQRLLKDIPSSVAVVANKRDHEWETRLDAHDIQFLSVSVFQSSAGVMAFEIDGSLHVKLESLGFGTCSVPDRSLRFDRTTRLPAGGVQLDDPAGGLSWWTVVHGTDAIWVTKDAGTPDIPDGALVQLIRAYDGRLVLKRTWEADGRRLRGG